MGMKGFGFAESLVALLIVGVLSLLATRVMHKIEEPAEKPVPGVTVEKIGRTSQGVAIDRARDSDAGIVCYVTHSGISCLPEKR